ncbi:ABC transporter substrate-binding protein [Bacillus sp. Hm123]|uniref:ABC transporter substrate-binding protein n=1 Tax=Bacillus sp. Hm123 TaxID=3450745 RepID=UPI003F424AB3
MKTRKIKKYLVSSVLLSALFVQSACSMPEKENAKETADKKTTKEKTEIVDHGGRTVQLPENRDRIAIGYHMPLPSAYFIATGSTDEIAGISPGSLELAKNSMLGKIDPGILDASTKFMESGEINAEELLKLNPDLFFSMNDTEETEMVEKLDIPTVAFGTLEIADGNVFETFYGWMELIGQVANKTERSEEIISYAKDTMKDTQDHLKNISEEDKPNALFFSVLEEKSLNVNGKGHFGHFWLTSTGTNNLAAPELSGNPSVNMEQVYKWNPEVIYISNFSATTPEDLYENRVKGQDWSKVDAVKNKRVYKVPEGIFMWYPPSADAPLMMKWMAQKNHPNTFNYYKIEDEIRDYYKRFYDYSLTDEEINQILNPIPPSS